MSYTATETPYIWKIRKWMRQIKNTKSVFLNESISWTRLTFFSSGALYGIKQLFLIKTSLVRIGCSLSNERFPTVSGFKIVIWTNSARNNFFKCMFLLGFRTLFTWYGPTYLIWWNHWLWGLVLGALTSSFQSISTTCNTTWCCWGSAGT